MIVHSNSKVKELWKLPVICIIWRRISIQQIYCIYSFSISELNSELVIQYLNENPDFLENYVLSHVNQERLQRWTAWKEQVRRQRHGENLNGNNIILRLTVYIFPALNRGILQKIWKPDLEISEKIKLVLHERAIR